MQPPSTHFNIVMAGLVQAIHVFAAVSAAKTWMPGTYAKRVFVLYAGHDDSSCPRTS
jgi:hypothetical protein